MKNVDKKREGMAAQLKSARHARGTLARLQELYPQAECALLYRNPWELLVATVLSAQCTDVRVNLVTPKLFARCSTPAAMAAMEVEELEGLIRSTGFYRNKAKNLLATAAVLERDFGGEVPARLEQLVTLPGVGRKTANVILGNAFGIPGMVVDTHIGRLARRLGWSRERDPVKVEADLSRLLPKKDWTRAGHLLIAHGRALCRARRPRCGSCPLASRCPRIGVTEAA